MGGRGASSTTGKGRGVGVANIGSFLTSFDLIDQKKALDDVVTSTIDEFINKQNYYLVAQSKRGGIIPAYAGNRLPAYRHAMQRRDHPRVCGEQYT